MDRIEDLSFFIDKIKREEKFALIRFGDGEIKVMNLAQKFDQVSNKRHGVIFDPDKEADNILSAELFTSLNLISNEYYVGLPTVERWRERIYPFMIKDREEYLLTSGGIFIGDRAMDQVSFLNSFIDMAISGKYIFNWICNSNIKKNKPSFIKKFFFIEDNGWKNQYRKLIFELLNYISKVENEIFLFGAAMLSNILIYHCWNINKSNTYIDIGSVFDPIIFDNFTRSYHKRIGPDLKKVKKRYMKYVGIT